VRRLSRSASSPRGPSGFRNDVAALPHRRTSKIDKENNTTIISGRDLGHVTAERVALLEGGQVVRDEPVTEATLGELRDYFAREVHL